MAKDFNVAEPQKVIDRNQKRLIPVNIAIMLLALLAALTLVFAPLITIDVGAVSDTLVTMITKSDSSESSSSSSSSSGSAEDTIATVLQSLNGMKLSLSIMDVTKVAFAEDPTEHISGYAADAVSQVADNLVGTVAVTMIPQILESSGADVDTENLDVEVILDKFDGLATAQDRTAAENAAKDLAAELQKQAKDKNGNSLISTSDLDNVQDYILDLYDETKAELDKKGEEMSMEALICVTVSKFMNSADENGESAAATPVPTASQTSGSSENKVYTNYNDLVNGLLKSSGGSEDSGIDQTLKESQKYLKIASGVLLTFPALYLILFIFAFVHTFTKNKRVLMWYVKLLGFIPCLIFGVAPLVAVPILGSLNIMSADMLALFGAISTTAWVSGICYLLLWLISIFWAFPIKRQIRHAKQHLKMEKSASAS